MAIDGREEKDITLSDELATLDNSEVAFVTKNGILYKTPIANLLTEASATEFAKHLKAEAQAYRMYNSSWNLRGFAFAADAAPSSPATNDIWAPQANGTFTNYGGVVVVDYKSQVIVKSSTGYSVETIENKTDVSGSFIDNSYVLAQLFNGATEITDGFSIPIGSTGENSHFRVKPVTTGLPSGAKSGQYYRATIAVQFTNYAELSAIPTSLYARRMNVASIIDGYLIPDWSNYADSIVGSTLTRTYRSYMKISDNDVSNNYHFEFGFQIKNTNTVTAAVNVTTPDYALFLGKSLIETLDKSVKNIYKSQSDISTLKSNIKDVSTFDVSTSLDIAGTRTSRKNIQLKAGQKLRLIVSNLSVTGETGFDYNVNIQDSNGSYIAVKYDEADETIDITVPSDADYFDINLGTSGTVNTFTSDVHVMYGTAAESSISKDDIYSINAGIQYSINEITVDTNGSGDFTTLKAAIDSIIDSSEKKRYIIYILEGIYDIINELGGESFLIQHTTEEGLTLPDFCSIIGIGNVELKGEISDTVIANHQNPSTYYNNIFSAVNKLSTLNLKRTNTVDNMKITAYNMRYAIHSDSANVQKDWKQQVLNSHIEHLGNPSGYWTSIIAMGCGMSSGATIEAYNSKFISTKKSGFSAHDNANFTVKSVLKFSNCEFICTGIDDSALLFQGLRMSTYGVGTIMNECHIFNSRMTGLVIEEESAGSGNRWVVYGSGNQPCGIKSVNTIGTAAFPVMSDETITVRLAESVVVGNPIKIINGKGYKITSDADNYLFQGIAIKSGLVDDIIPVKNRGFIPYSLVNMTTGTTGNKIGIISGVLGVVTGTEYIGIATASYWVSEKYRGFMLSR